jgi:hypothetical protein
MVLILVLTAECQEHPFLLHQLAGVSCALENGRGRWQMKSTAVAAPLQRPVLHHRDRQGLRIRARTQLHDVPIDAQHQGKCKMKENGEKGGGEKVPHNCKGHTRQQTAEKRHTFNSLQRNEQRYMSEEPFQSSPCKKMKTGGTYAGPQRPWTAAPTTTPLEIGRSQLPLSLT